MRVCVECDEPIDPLSPAHSAHEPGCPVDPDSEDWYCGCDAFAHIRCCRACKAVDVTSSPAEVPRGVLPRPARNTG